MIRSPTPAAERMRQYRHRRRWKRLQVRVELDTADISALAKRGYLDPKLHDDVRAIEEAANTFISDALKTSQQVLRRGVTL